MEFALLGGIVLLYRMYHGSHGSDISGKPMSLAQIVDFIAEDSAMVDDLRPEIRNQVGLMRTLIQATVNCTQLGSMMGTDITMRTVAAIYLIAALTFKSPIVPAILALRIVECILMGATIDYGILFTNYYRESHRTLGARDALKKACAGSIHTGKILVPLSTFYPLSWYNEKTLPGKGAFVCPRKKPSANAPLPAGWWPMCEPIDEHHAKVP